MKRLRYAAIFGALCCLISLAGCGATNVSASLSAHSDSTCGTNTTCATSDDVVESRIDGEFTGWDGSTEFKLENGQLWRQSSYDYTYHYAYRPAVTIYKDGFDWKLKVEGLDDTITVEQVY